MKHVFAALVCLACTACAALAAQVNDVPRITLNWSETAPALDTNFDLTAMPDVIRVDGSNGVWDRVYRPEESNGVCAFAFRLQATPDALWVQAEVSDDAIVTDNCAPGLRSCASWDDDALELFFDGNNNGAPDSRANDGEELRWGGEFALVANGSAMSAFSGYPDSFGTLWTGVVSRTACGVRYAVRIGWPCLGQPAHMNPTNDFSFGFNVCIHDDDDGGRCDHALYYTGSPEKPYSNESAFARIRIH